MSSSDQRPKQQHPRFRRNYYNSNDARNPNAASSSMAPSDRRNGNGNGRRATDRDSGPSTSRPIHSVNYVNCVMVPSNPQPIDDDEGWGTPNPKYFEKMRRREEREQQNRRAMYEDAWKPKTRHHVGQAALPPERLPAEGRADGRGPVRRMVAQGAVAQGSIAQGACSWYSREDWRIEPQADFGYSTDKSYDYGRVMDDWGDDSHLLEPQSASEIVPLAEFNALSVRESDEGTDDGNCSKDSGVYDWRKNEEAKERTSEAILKVYSNDLLLETIISHITKLSDRSQVEMASRRMQNVSKMAPYRFSEGGDHLHIHFTTFDDFATIQYGSVVRTVPILTMNTRRFDKMESKMTIALERILRNIGSRFTRKVRKITLGGTTEFYSARGVPDHHLILTHDFLKYLFETFRWVTSLHLINCGLDDGAIDLCHSPLWKETMARMQSIELRTVWADTPNRLPTILNSVSCNLEYFTLTRFTCKRMGSAILEQMRKAKCRLREVQLVIDEDTAEGEFEMLCLLKEVASRTDSLRITVAEIGDGSQLSPKCFSILPRLRDVANLTELKFYVQPKTADQFQSIVTLFRDMEFLTSLRTLHLEGFSDQNWLSVEMIYNLADAFKTGMTYLAETLEDVSFANFPKPTKYNAHGFRGERKEPAYECLWESMASSVGSRRTRRLALTSMRLEDKHLAKIYRAISKVAEEVYLKNIRRVTAKSVLPLVNGEFPMLRQMEAEIAIDPLVLNNLGEVARTPHLQYAKLALKRRISNEDHHTKFLRAMFSSVFVDQESPRGPLRQFVEVRNRIPGAKPPTPVLEPQSGTAQPRQANRAPRPFDYRAAGYGMCSNPSNDDGRSPLL